MSRRSGGGGSRWSGAGQDSAGFARYLAALDARHEATGRQVILVLDNGAGHTSKASHGRAGRAGGLAGGDLAGPLQPAAQPEGAGVADASSGTTAAIWPRTLRAFVDERWRAAAAGRGAAATSSTRCPPWWLAGHRKEPTGRPPGRPKGAKDSPPPAPRAQELTSTYLVVCHASYAGFGGLASPPGFRVMPSLPRHLGVAGNPANHP